LKNSLLELTTQLATAASDKKQLELRLQAINTTLTEAQQVAQTRVTEAASDKSARAKAMDELQQVRTSLQKLKEVHEQLTSTANAQGGSAADVAIREERAKLLVSGERASARDCARRGQCDPSLSGKLPGSSADLGLGSHRLSRAQLA
jgi:predicted ATP-dependent protease